MLFKAIIFDCDGVIVDTETISNNIIQSKLAELGLILGDQKVQTLFTGYTTKQNLITASNLLQKELPADFEYELKSAYLEEMKQNLETIQGIPELIKGLSPALAMATNAQRADMEFKLSKLGLTEVFKRRFCVNDVKHPKPAPDLYQLASQSLNIPPKDCLVIEDSLAGIKAAYDAGMTVFAYSQKMDANSQLKAGASQCFNSMSELQHHLNQLNLYR